MRTIESIARDIRASWRNVSPYAKPYLDYMVDPWGHDSVESAALYFLSNASTWRGDDAKRLKAELKATIAKLKGAA